MLGANQVESMRCIAGKNLIKMRIPEAAANDFGQDVAKVGCDLQVAGAVELLGVEARPLAIDFTALHTAANHEGTVAVAVIGAMTARSP